MHRLKNMKETLVGCVQAQLADIKNADTKELGEAIDMIKDLEEAMYYCSIVKAMEKQEEEEEMMEKMGKKHPQELHHYYTPIIRPIDYMDYPYDRDMDREMGRMYYSSNQPRNSQGEFTRGRRGGTRRNYEDYFPYMSEDEYSEKEVPVGLRDAREGKSGMSRRNYMESKELHHGKEKKIKELEKYMQELTQDIVEMIEDASPEEKQMLEKKMTHLTSKIAQLNQNG